MTDRTTPPDTDPESTPNRPKTDPEAIPRRPESNAYRPQIEPN